MAIQVLQVFAQVLLVGYTGLIMVVRDLLVVIQVLVVRHTGPTCRLYRSYLEVIQVLLVSYTGLICSRLYRSYK